MFSTSSSSNPQSNQVLTFTDANDKKKNKKKNNQEKYFIYIYLTII